jgi:heat shock protein 1/8
MGHWFVVCFGYHVTDMKHWPFRVVRGSDDRPLISVTWKGESKTFTPEEISAFVLQRMRDVAQAFVGEPITKSVITVPAYFSDAQRQATKVTQTSSTFDLLS